MIGAFFKRVSVVLDIALNVFPLFGQVEPISSRCGRQIVNGKVSRPCCILCKLLDKRWLNHCVNNIWNPLK
jgi:hypothetical protein